MELKKIIEKKLFPLLVPTGQKMTDYYDDNYKAHLRTILYRNSVRNKHL